MQDLTKTCGRSCWRMVASSNPSAQPTAKSTSFRRQNCSRRMPARPGS